MESMAVSNKGTRKKTVKKVDKAKYPIQDFSKEWRWWLDTLKEEIEHSVDVDLFGKTGIPEEMSDDDYYDKIDEVARPLLMNLDENMWNLDEYFVFHNGECNAMAKVWNAAPIKVRKEIASIIVNDIIGCKIRGIPKR